MLKTLLVHNGRELRDGWEAKLMLRYNIVQRRKHVREQEASDI